MEGETHCAVVHDVDAIGGADEAHRGCVGVVDRGRRSWVVDVTPRVACTHAFNGIRTWCDARGSRCAEGEVERALWVARVALVAGLDEPWRELEPTSVVRALIVALVRLWEAAGDDRWAPHVVGRRQHGILVVFPAKFRLRYQIAISLELLIRIEQKELTLDSTEYEAPSPLEETGD